jgi:hypothetical protein
MLCECVQRTAHREAEINGSHPRVTVLREVREGLEGLLEIADGCVVGRPD